MKKPETKLQELVNRLQHACGDNLVSVVLYGSTAREEFHEQYSDVNVLVLCRELSSGHLSAVAPVVRWWSHEERLTPPLLMTIDEMRESADVFAIELLDIQNTHRTLFGEDIASTIQVPMNLHRVEVEHELRSTLLRLRQHLLLSPDKEEELRMVLVKSITSVLTLIRHALITLGDDPPQDRTKLLEHASKLFGFDLGPLQVILKLRNDPAHRVNVNEAYNAYMKTIGQVAHHLDQRVPKRHWRKVPQSA
jgi:predicted nucleotidyltransferase